MTAITIPMRTGRGLNDRHLHWSGRHRAVKAERRTVALFLPAKRPDLPLAVTLTRLAPSNGLDKDNLQGALKATRDQIAAWLGVDDADPRVTWHYGQRRAPWGVEVEVTT